MALCPPCRGVPNKEFFESPESMQGFEKVGQWLEYFCKTHVQSCPPTKESLSQLLISFMQFQDTKLGKICSKMSSKPPIMRVPMRCVLDFACGGSLCHIFANMYRYKYEQKWTEFNFNVTETADQDQNLNQNIQMSKEIFEKLIEHKFFRLPTIYITPDIDDDMRVKINVSLKNLQCEITTEQNQATHIIYPEIACSNESYARPWFKRGQHIMIHWYYLPQSYDLWVQNTFDLPENIIGEMSESVDFPLKSWRVSAEWVLHSQEYNEWMAEEDYEVNKNGERIIHQHQLTVADFFNEKPTDRRPNTAKTKIKNIPLKRLQRHKSSQPSVLPKTGCPDCGKMIAAKVLNRHRQEKHAAEVERLECSLCSFTTKRASSLMDHQRRQHFEPVKKGRVGKNQKPPRKRSPFRKNVFDDRHKTSMQILQVKSKLDSEHEQLNEIKEKLERMTKTETENMKNEERLKALEEFQKKTYIEARKVKTRVTIIESKQTKCVSPNLTDISSLLNYFNLTKNCTKEDIRKTINLRLMEISPESLVSEEIFAPSNMTQKKRQELTMFYNKASDVLLKWRKKANISITID